jgi:hypothetical protein
MFVFVGVCRGPCVIFLINGTFSRIASAKSSVEGSIRGRLHASPASSAAAAAIATDTATLGRAQQPLGGLPAGNRSAERCDACRKAKGSAAKCKELDHLPEELPDVT